jgi:hypothetical protein
MKKLIYIFLAFIAICNYSNAQFNVMDSATLINVTQYQGFYNLALTPANAPVGPDYTSLTTTTHPKWYRWTVCGSDQANYDLGISFYLPLISSQSSIAIWGPFSDTVGITSKLNAAHLNQYFNINGVPPGDINIPKADSVGIYIMLVCASNATGYLGFSYDIYALSTGVPSNLYYDNRCNICSTSIVNYVQKICIVSYDTTYRTYSIYWDKQQNSGIASYNILRDNVLLANIPVTDPGYYLDQTFVSTYPWVTYKLVAIDSCGNSSPSLNYTSATPKAGASIYPDNSCSAGYYFIPSPPAGTKAAVFRGPNESNMLFVDSIVASQYTDSTSSHGLTYYSFSYNNVAGCHPDSITTFNEIRTSPILVQRICGVAFDTVQQKNVVMWDKQDNNQVDHYNIYSDGLVANQSDSIGWVAENAPALFVDMNVYPNTKPISYIVRPVYANGIIPSNLSLGIHTTMHLKATPGWQGKIDLTWNPYVGFGYQKFYLYRGNSLNTMQLFDSVASTIYSYTDFTPANGANYYQVAVHNPYGCTPDSSTIVFESRSNDAYVLINAISDLQAQQLKLYPNPAKDFTVLDYNLLPEIKQFELINSIGKTVNIFEGNAQHKITINTSNLSKGVYYLSAKTDKGLLRKKLVVL